MPNGEHPASVPDVVIVGSLNVDYIVEIPHRPTAGETVIGADVQLRPGGKGANQAVAVAHAGGHAVMVGRVGADPDAEVALDALRARGVDVAHVGVVDDARTGNAYILVTPDGENSIVVASGANRRVDVDAAMRVVAERRPRAVLLQGELPPATTAKLLKRLAADRAHVVVNLAPVTRLPKTCWLHWDALVVNAGEAAVLLGDASIPVDGAADAAARLRRRDDQIAVITLGSAGAVGAHAHGVVRVEAPRVDVVDTTGAGDAFVGALALGLARRRTLEEALEAAVLAGARAVEHIGAQPPPPPR